VEAFNNELKLEIKCRKGVLISSRGDFLKEFTWLFNNKKDRFKRILKMIKIRFIFFILGRKIFGGGIQYFTKKRVEFFLKKEPLKMENQNFRINDLIEIFNDYFYNRIIKCIKCNSVCRWKSKNKLLVYCTEKL
ncbi:hypothetical protein H311_03336, partial [Anncaliia algerae PRA109]